MITSWAGKLTPNPTPAPFKMSWGTALDLLPGSDGEPGRAAQAQPAPSFLETAAEKIFWSAFFDYVGHAIADSLRGSKP